MKTKKNPDVELGNLAVKAIDRLQEFFNEKEFDGKDIAVARVSTAVLGAWTRAQQTRSAEKQTLFMVAREIASDKEQLKKYIGLTMPETGVLTALPEAVDLATENAELKKENQILKKEKDRYLLKIAETQDTLVKPGD